MNKWEPDPDPHQARRVGKSLEEVSELGGVLARISIQGLNGIDPASGKTNRLRYLEESADVIAQLDCNHTFFKITTEEAQFVMKRAARKVNEMQQWEDHFK